MALTVGWKGVGDKFVAVFSAKETASSVALPRALFGGTTVAASVIGLVGGVYMGKWVHSRHAEAIREKTGVANDSWAPPFVGAVVGGIVGGLCGAGALHLASQGRVIQGVLSPVNLGHVAAVWFGGAALGTVAGVSSKNSPDPDVPVICALNSVPWGMLLGGAAYYSLSRSQL